MIRKSASSITDHCGSKIAKNTKYNWKYCHFIIKILKLNSIWSLSKIWKALMAQRFLKINNYKIMARFCNCCFSIWKFYIPILMKENSLKGKPTITILNLEFRWLNGFLVEHIAYLLKFNTIRSCFSFHKLFKERKCEINVWNS